MMSVGGSDRFHNAARDGYLDLLRDATRRDCNIEDEDGMTPTMWAAACGNLDALRMLIGRGGDPNKSDFYGNTCLHCAAANNQINCVSYLVNFGVNLFALDNEYHTAKELAGIKGHNEVLRYLDTVISKQTSLNGKTVQKQKEKAIADAEKRIKELEKLQKKATRKAEKDEKKLAKERTKMTTTINDNGRRSSSIVPGSISFSTLRRDSRMLYESPRFSEIVSTSGQSHGTTKSKGLTGVSKKILKTKQNNNGNTALNNPQLASTDFKVREIESDGKRSIRSLTGLRRDSEVMYVPKYDTTASTSQEPRKRLQDIFDTTGGRIHRIASEPFLPGVGLNDDDDDIDMPIQPPQSLFERPGFGNVAFRQNSLSGTLLSITKDFGSTHRKAYRAPLPPRRHSIDEDSARTSDHGSERRSHDSTNDSIGSAGSLAHRNRDDEANEWMEDDDDLDREDDAEGSLEMFLVAYDLRSCLPQLRREQIDLKALLLLNESDLKELGFSLGTRKKLMDAIVRRKDALQEAGEVYDSRL